LQSFQERATQCLLAGYREAFAVSDAAQKQEQQLLTLFLIEKAAYEITYEAANRPAWITVPLHGLARSFATLEQA
jgi:maltose alpha-D-glucosyltransferase/alpha-amylase